MHWHLTMKAVHRKITRVFHLTTRAFLLTIRAFHWNKKGASVVIIQQYPLKKQVQHRSNVITVMVVVTVSRTRLMDRKIITGSIMALIVVIKNVQNVTIPRTVQLVTYLICRGLNLVDPVTVNCHLQMVMLR